jgi:hypothetical protein
MVKKVTKEFIGRKSKPALEEGGENHNRFGIEGRNVLSLRRSPLQHGAVGGGGSFPPARGDRPHPQKMS